MTTWLGPSVGPGGVAGYWFIYQKWHLGKKVLPCLLSRDARKKLQSTRVKLQAELIHPVGCVKLLLHFLLSFIFAAFFFFVWNHSFVNLRSVCCTSTIVFDAFWASTFSVLLWQYDFTLFVFIIYFSKNKGTENSLFFPFSVLKGSSSWLRMPRLCSWSFSWGGQKANTQIRE